MLCWSYRSAILQTSLQHCCQLLLRPFSRLQDFTRSFDKTSFCSVNRYPKFDVGLGKSPLTHWGRVTHICVSELPNIGSDNGLSPGRRQAIIRTNAAILLIRTLGINFSEILSEIHTFSFKKCSWKCRLENVGHFVSASMCWVKHGWIITPHKG